MPRFLPSELELKKSLAYFIVGGFSGLYNVSVTDKLLTAWHVSALTFTFSFFLLGQGLQRLGIADPGVPALPLQEEFVRGISMFGCGFLLATTHAVNPLRTDHIDTLQPY